MTTPATWTKAFPPAKSGVTMRQDSKAGIVICSALRQRERVRRVSKARARLMRQDVPAAEWLARPENRWCAVCLVDDFKVPATERHHTRGRTRKLQNDDRWRVPICHPHHLMVKADPTWAKSIILYPGTKREQPLLANGNQWMNSEAP